MIDLIGEYDNYQVRFSIAFDSEKNKTTTRFE